MNIKFIPVPENSNDDNPKQEEVTATEKDTLITENIDNPLLENIYEFNSFDNAYTETQTLPNPQVNPKSKIRSIELD